jgi:hypothetical protein
LEEYKASLETELTHKRTTQGAKCEVAEFECKEMKRGCKYTIKIKTMYDSLKWTVLERTCGHDHSALKKTKLDNHAKKFMLENKSLTAGQMQMKLKVCHFQAQ